MKTHKILIVGPTDFGICDHIVESLIQSGHEVLFVPEIPRSGVMIVDRLISRLPIKILSLWLAKLIVWRGNTLNMRDPDIFLVIRGRYLNAQSLNYISENLVIKKKLMYQWDSSNSLPLFKEQIQFFDTVTTFDFSDACSFGIKHRHLFHFMPTSLLLNDAPAEYSICFIGTLHGDRGLKVSEFLEENKRFKNSAFISLYMPCLT